MNTFKVIEIQTSPEQEEYLNCNPVLNGVFLGALAYE